MSSDTAATVPTQLQKLKDGVNAKCAQLAELNRTLHEYLRIFAILLTAGGKLAQKKAAFSKMTAFEQVSGAGKKLQAEIKELSDNKIFLACVTSVCESFKVSAKDANDHVIRVKHFFETGTMATDLLDFLNDYTQKIEAQIAKNVEMSETLKRALDDKLKALAPTPVPPVEQPKPTTKSAPKPKSNAPVPSTVFTLSGVEIKCEQLPNVVNCVKLDLRALWSLFTTLGWIGGFLVDLRDLVVTRSIKMTLGRRAIRNKYGQVSPSFDKDEFSNRTHVTGRLTGLKSCIVSFGCSDGQHVDNSQTGDSHYIMLQMDGDEMDSQTLFKCVENMLFGLNDHGKTIVDTWQNPIGFFSLLERAIDNNDASGYVVSREKKPFTLWNAARVIDLYYYLTEKQQALNNLLQTDTSLAQELKTTLEKLEQKKHDTALQKKHDAILDQMFRNDVEIKRLRSILANLRGYPGKVASHPPPPVKAVTPRLLDSNREFPWLPEGNLVHTRIETTTTVATPDQSQAAVDPDYLDLLRELANEDCSALLGDVPVPDTKIIEEAEEEIQEDPNELMHRMFLTALTTGNTRPIACA